MHKPMPHIRPFEAKDQDQVSSLLSQLTGKPIALNATDLLKDPACNCIVVEENNIAIGFASLIIYYLPTVGKVGKIEEVVVDERYRGQGIGRKIMEELIGIAQKNNLRKLQLTSSPRRTSARALYQSMGFKIKDTNVFTMDI